MILPHSNEKVAKVDLISNDIGLNVTEGIFDEST